MKIKELLVQNEDYYKLIYDIVHDNILEEIKGEAANIIFKKIKENIDKKYKSSYCENIDRDYYHFEDRFPNGSLVNLSYKYNGFDDIIVTFQLSNNTIPCIGYAVRSYNDKDKKYGIYGVEKETFNELKKQVPLNYLCGNGFLHKEFCSVENYTDPPNFRTMNEAAIKLCINEKTRQEFIENCSNRMIELLDKKNVTSQMLP